MREFRNRHFSNDIFCDHLTLLSECIVPQFTLASLMNEYNLDIHQALREVDKAVETNNLVDEEIEKIVPEYKSDEENKDPAWI